jgi:hypothetical protein
MQDVVSEWNARGLKESFQRAQGQMKKLVLSTSAALVLSFAGDDGRGHRGSLGGETYD